MVHRVHDVFVPERREYAANSGFAHFAADGVLVHTRGSHDLGERLQFLDSTKQVQMRNWEG